MTVGRGSNARTGATQDEVEASCRRAQIHEVIAGLPDGDDTVVGERGYHLSEGKKQRLAIARMLLEDPAIVRCVPVARRATRRRRAPAPPGVLSLGRCTGVGGREHGDRGG